MNIGGLQKLSFIDYPGYLSAVVFTQACPFRCCYCHNAELVIPQKFAAPLSQKETLAFLMARVGKLEGVVISGGEPTVQAGLFHFLRQIKEMGFVIKLDTMGVRPHILEELLSNNLIDYIAMDIKAPWGKYPEVIQRPVVIENIQKSANLIRQSSLPYEFRSTLLKELHTPEDILVMAQQIRGAKSYVLQRFRPGKTLNSQYQNAQSFSKEEIEKLLPRLREVVHFVHCR